MLSTSLSSVSILCDHVNACVANVVVLLLQPIMSHDGS